MGVLAEHVSQPAYVGCMALTADNSKGAAFYASGNIASEALMHYCTDLWTESYAVKAVRDDEQRM